MSSDEKLKDSKWARSTVRKILTDIAYIGHRLHGRRQDVDVDYREIFKDKIFCVDCVESMTGKKEYRPCQFAVSKLQKKLLKHWLKELSLAWSMHTPLSINLILGNNIP